MRRKFEEPCSIVEACSFANVLYRVSSMYYVFPLLQSPCLSPAPGRPRSVPRDLSSPGQRSWARVMTRGWRRSRTGTRDQGTCQCSPARTVSSGTAETRLWRPGAGSESSPPPWTWASCNVTSSSRRHRSYRVIAPGIVHSLVIMQANIIVRPRHCSLLA